MNTTKFDQAKTLQEQMEALDELEPWELESEQARAAGIRHPSMPWLIRKNRETKDATTEEFVYENGCGCRVDIYGHRTYWCGDHF